MKIDRVRGVVLRSAAQLRWYHGQYTGSSLQKDEFFYGVFQFYVSSHS